MITDYRPMEVWEFAGSDLTRYNQPDAGDLEVKVACIKCGSSEVDAQGMDLQGFDKAKLVTLSDDAWDQKVG